MYTYITILAQAMPICVTGFCWPQCLLDLGDICTMPSYGDRRMPCTWCGREGQCLWPEYLAAPHLVSLLDVDGIGPICDRCSDRGRPPQYDDFGGAVEQQVDGNPHLHVTCTLAHSLSVFGRPKGKSQKGGVATARPDFVTETSRPDSPLSHLAVSEDAFMASNSFPSWWRTPINEWPPHTFEWPPPPHIKTERLPSGWNCRCGRNDMSWRHQEPPHVDAMCFQCFTLMEADGIVMDEWCRCVRSKPIALRCTVEGAAVQFQISWSV